MKEQLISFETAKLAKEKGFDGICRHCYHSFLETGEEYEFKIPLLREFTQRKFQNSIITKYNISAPTQSLLQKWLRDVHKINVYCTPSDFEAGIWYNNIASHNPVFTGSYEEVLEIGLQEGLKLIKNNN